MIKSSLHVSEYIHFQWFPGCNSKLYNCDPALHRSLPTPLTCVVRMAVMSAKWRSFGLQPRAPYWHCFRSIGGPFTHCLLLGLAGACHNAFSHSSPLTSILPFFHLSLFLSLSVPSPQPNCLDKQSSHKVWWCALHPFSFNATPCSMQNSITASLSLYYYYYVNFIRFIFIQAVQKINQIKIWTKSNWKGLATKSLPKLACTAWSEALALIVGKRSPFESSGIK